MIRWIFFWACIAVWFGSFFVIVTCLCRAAKRGDETAGRLVAHFDSIPATIRLGHEQLDISNDQRAAEIVALEEWAGR